MTPRPWWHLLRQGRFQISFSRMPMAVGISIATLFNLSFAWIESILMRGRIKRAQLHGPVIFIVGHWRSGTTLLHELLVRDERFSSPSTFQCFAPSHFLVTEWFFRRFGRWMLPGKRPMDNMTAGWDRPQEDEFALVNLGLPSPYRRLAFPAEGPVDMDHLDFQGVSEPALEDWIATLRSFLLRVSVATERPLVIKSPTHTGRVAYLAKAFPQAKFIHLTRDPRALYPSTCRLWASLDEAQRLQGVAPESHPGYVLDCLERMYAAFHDQRDQIAAKNLIDLRYEDLVRDPVESMSKIYGTLRLADFETVRGDLETWVEEEHREYQPNTHALDEETESLLRERWRDYYERYGYGETN